MCMWSYPYTYVRGRKQAKNDGFIKDLYVHVVYLRFWSVVKRDVVGWALLLLTSGRFRKVLHAQRRDKCELDGLLHLLVSLLSVLEPRQCQISRFADSLPYNCSTTAMYSSLYTCMC